MLYTTYEETFHFKLKNIFVYKISVLQSQSNFYSSKMGKLFNFS